jgi:hypothetical protein
MKKNLIIVLMTLNLSAYCQDKYNYVHFNKLTEVIGTEYVIASIENWGKVTSKGKYLLFINSNTGDAYQVDFPNDAGISKLEQVKNDTLGINLMVVAAQTVDLDNKNGIDWNDPTQIIVLSIDGRQKTQLTDDSFFVRTWSVNNLTGTIVITGYHDSNRNNKYDKTDKNEIHLYNLRTLKLISKI